MPKNIKLLALASTLFMGAAIANAHAAAPGPMTWVTLGTNGGPVANKTRSEPANMLLVDGKPWVVDCGDGCVEQLAKVGVKPGDVDVVFLSHLHMDHIGGLQGLLGLRWMVGAQSVMTIYGPPGTQALIDGLVASLAPSEKISADGPLQGLDPSKAYKVVTLKGGDAVTVDGVKVRVAQNTHYDADGAPAKNGSQSVSYRFDGAQRSITYTGDTGPSKAVAQLASGTDLLVSEVIDLDTMDKMVEADTAVPQHRRAQMVEHFKTQHLSPQEAGKIAAEAHAKALVFTHLAIKGPTEQVAPTLINEAHTTYSGPVSVAKDLDKF